MDKPLRHKWSQTQIIAVGFLCIILVGSLLLTLPIASRSGNWTNFLEALFTATSATCVTGLIVVDTYQHWSVFGQVIILTMIQIGGLGFMTIGTLFSILLGRKIGLKERGILQESVNTLEIGGIVKLTKKILIGTCLFEGVGAVLLAIRFIPQFGAVKGTYYAIFHSISAFCNAGFDLMGEFGEYRSLVDYYDDPIINFTIMSLIVIGGIGFLVWDDLSKHGLHFKKYMMHTKIVLLTTFALIFGGALLFYAMEYNKVLADMSVGGRIWSSLFASVTARTAGFNTVDTAAISGGSKLLTMILMFVGGSPGSTAGGIKTTTVVVMFICMFASIKKTTGYNIFNRRLEDGIVKKATAVFMTNLSLVLAACLIICTVQEIPVTDVMFEAFSAMGTVGMSTGITRELNLVSRFVIIFLMYCGRIGSLTFALTFAQRKKVAPVQYPVEKITIG